MRIEDLQYFMATARSGGIARAAQDLGISQPALSKAIARLENQLRVKLFEREARGVRLTEIGRSFLPRAEALALGLQDSLSELRDLRHGVSGQVRFGIGAGLPSHLLTQACQRALARGSYKFEIRAGMTDVLLASLAGGDIDFIVSGNPRLASDDIVWKPLFADPMVAVAPLGHALLGQPERASWAELADAQWILPATGTVSRQAFDGNFLTRGIEPPTPLVESRQSAREFELAEALGSLVLVPESLAIDPGLQGRFARIRLPAGWRWQRSVAILHRRFAYLNDATKTFMADLESTAKSLYSKRAAIIPPEPGRHGSPGGNRR